VEVGSLGTRLPGRNCTRRSRTFRMITVSASPWCGMTAPQRSASGCSAC